MTEISLTSDLVGILHSLGLIPALILIYAVWDQRNRHGVRWLITGLVAGGVWAVTIGSAIAVDQRGLTILLARIQLVVGSIGAVSLFFLAYENSYSEIVPSQYVPVMLVVPGITAVLLVVQPSTVVEMTVTDSGFAVVQQYDPWYFVDRAYGFGLNFVAGSFWLGSALASDGRKRWQSVTFVGATVILFVSAGLSAVGWPGPPVDIFVGGFLLATVVITAGLIRFEAFDINPAVMQTVIDKIDDPIVVLTPDNRVAATNDAAIALFDAPSEATGLHATDLLATSGVDIPWDGDTTGEEPTITVSIGEPQRYFVLDRSPIRYGRGSRGRVLVFRDVTEQERHRRDLAVLKSVLSRVFRHNIRNDLSAVHGYAEIIADRSDGEIQEFAETIAAKAMRLHGQSEKAREMETIVERTERVLLDTEAAIEEATASYEEVVETDTAPATVLAHPRLALAVEELVENAVEHQSGTPSVRVSTEQSDGTVIVSVVDDGPGIDEGELAVLYDGQETSLEHGSGVGLWLVRWIVERSEGHLDHEVTPNGTTIKIHLDDASKKATEAATVDKVRDGDWGNQ